MLGMPMTAYMPADTASGRVGFSPQQKLFLPGPAMFKAPHAAFAIAGGPQTLQVARGHKYTQK